MSERAKHKRSQTAQSQWEARLGATFWDGVECEVEALDPGDFALFLGADALEIEPRPAFARSLSRHVAALARTRWSN
jgi:hypothetical protein